MHPKRKASDQKGGDKPHKRARPVDEDEDPEDMGEEEEDEEEQKQAADLHWKNEGRFKLAEGSEDGPQLNKKDVSKLTLRFRRKAAPHAESVTQFPTIAWKDINWGNSAHISEINRWRRQNLLRHGFEPLKNVTPWQRSEEALLQLLYRELGQRAIPGQEVRGPTTKQVAEHLNAFFKGKMIDGKHGRKIRHKGERTEDMVTNKLRDRNPVGKYAKGVKDKLSKDKTVPFRMPSITEEQLDEFMRELDTDAQTRKTAGKMLASGTKIEKGGSKDQGDGTRPGAVSTSGAVPDDSGDTTGAGDQQTSTSNNSQSNNDPQRPSEYPASLTPQKHIEVMLNSGWSIPSVPNATKAEEATEQDKPTLKDEWMYKAIDALHTRWSKSRTNEFSYLETLASIHNWKYYHAPGKRNSWYAAVPQREADPRLEDPQAVNAMLGLAVYPPVGYGGDMKNLMRKGWPGWGKVERVVAWESERAVRWHYGKHDVKFDHYCKSHVEKLSGK